MRLAPVLFVASALFACERVVPLELALDPETRALIVAADPFGCDVAPCRFVLVAEDLDRLFAVPRESSEMWILQYRDPLDALDLTAGLLDHCGASDRPCLESRPLPRADHLL